MSHSSPPAWRLPEGMTRGLWDYTHARHIAEDYDDFFAYNELFVYDRQVVMQLANPGDAVLDLGCGTGRLLEPLARAGCNTLGVDYSESMLRVLGAKARQQGLPICGVRANMVELDFLRDDAFDLALCMFSTLGMVRGRRQRRSMLRQVRRVLRPGGALVCHAHSYWHNLFAPGGWWFIAKNVTRALVRGDVEIGDKFFVYRGVPNMFLHVYRRGEFRADLRRAGFHIEQLTPLAHSRHRPLPRPWLFGAIRANGWIAVCR